MLNVSSICVNYGKVQVLKDVTLKIPDHNIVTLLGANGAGKTTTMHSIAGLLNPSKGCITYNGKRIDRFPPARIVQLGISMVPEGRMIFPQMTVYENLEIGAFVRRDTREVKKDFNKIYEYFPVLRDRKKQLSATLSGGEQQMLAIGRALMSRPKVLLLDEPSLGLAPLIVKKIFEIIKKINQEEGCAILLVEQNARLALSISHFGYIMEVGEVVLSDDCSKLQENDEVKKVYLGE